MREAIFKSYQAKAEEEDRRHVLPDGRIPSYSYVFGKNLESLYCERNKYIISEYSNDWLFNPTIKVFKDVKDYFDFKEQRTCNDILKLKSLDRTGFFTKYQNNQAMAIYRKVLAPNGRKKRYCYCKVKSKWLLGYGVRRFLFQFRPDPKDSSKKFTLVMFVNNYDTFADTMYKGTKLRWCGTTLMHANRGSRDFKLIILEDDELCLADSEEKLLPNNELIKCKGFFTGRSTGNPAHPKRFEHPFAIYHKYNYVKQGALDFFSTIRKDSLFEVRQMPLNNSYEDTLVLLCMALVLKNQESQRKQKPDTEYVRAQRGKIQHMLPAASKR
ncbi:uncharacterized protein PRCAT00002907001 [Priceomyces carsonii]|uniref:uncharacterized protein n=1 Tax=Priceomyces carsonii TaxID=28549 RepID=UPI002ED82F81|nr:unnamed protein product [Priceomyces carsonii]